LGDLNSSSCRGGVFARVAFLSSHCIEKVCIFFKLFAINYYNKYTKENTSLKWNKILLWNVQHLHYLKWFLSYEVMNSWFRSVPWLKNWMQAQANFIFCALEYGNCTFVIGCTHVAPQMQSCNCPAYEVSSFKSHNLSGLWIWFSPWSGLRLKLPCTRSQQIWTLTGWSFLQSILLSQDDRTVYLFNILSSKRWKFFSTSMFSK
jgi:hypothetical protein